MNINYKQLIIVLFLSFLSINTFADSPITSTNFGKAYLKHAIVAKAAKSNGILTKPMLEYLAKESNPIEIKLALINQLGWSIKGKNNGERYLLSSTD